jgi:hypothetical protein
MDRKAKNILFKSYWGSDGRHPLPKAESQDVAYAKAQGAVAALWCGEDKFDHEAVGKHFGKWHRG